MRDLNKPKYDALLKCCKSQGFFTEYDTITENNCEEIISSFIPENIIAYKREGLCFCNKKLKNVYVLQCYNKVFIECGSNCLKTVFGSEDEIKKRANRKITKDFLDGTLNNGLGFEKIEDYERYIIEVITRLVKSISTRKLFILRDEYSENDDIVNIIHTELIERQRIEDEKEEERQRLEREEEKRIEEQKEIEKQRLIDNKRSQEEYEERERQRQKRIAEQKKKDEEFNKWYYENLKKLEDDKKKEGNKLQDFIKSMREEAIRKAKQSINQSINQSITE